MSRNAREASRQQWHIPDNPSTEQIQFGAILRIAALKGQITKLKKQKLP